MSGSGNSSFSGNPIFNIATGEGIGNGSGGEGGSNNSCLNLSFLTQLTSPKNEVVSKLVEGDVLNIIAQEVSSNLVLIACNNDEVAGGITSPYSSKLRECIQQGSSYVAIVLEINGGQVKVSVQHT